jgi:hypothetical protein
VDDGVVDNPGKRTTPQSRIRALIVPTTKSGTGRPWQPCSHQFHMYRKNKQHSTPNSPRAGKLCSSTIRSRQIRTTQIDPHTVNVFTTSRIFTMLHLLRNDDSWRLMRGHEKSRLGIHNSWWLEACGELRNISVESRKSSKIQSSA